MEGSTWSPLKPHLCPAPNCDAVGGAYINVFTAAATESEALDIASREVAGAGWRLDAVDEVVRVTRADYTADDSGLEYFEQALVDGIVLVIYSYPPDADESDARH